MSVDSVVASTADPFADLVGTNKSQLYGKRRTPLNIPVLIEKLGQFPQKTALELVKGLTEGFSMHYEGPRVH